jgi:hypothetical protein
MVQFKHVIENDKNIIFGGIKDEERNNKFTHGAACSVGGLWQW